MERQKVDFGWDLPPGVSHNDIPGVNDDEYPEVDDIRSLIEDDCDGATVMEVADRVYELCREKEALEIQLNRLSGKTDGGLVGTALARMFFALDLENQHAFFEHIVASPEDSDGVMWNLIGDMIGASLSAPCCPAPALIDRAWAEFGRMFETALAKAQEIERES